MYATNNVHLVDIINSIHWSKNARIGKPKKKMQLDKFFKNNNTQL
jgi:hypothetical protein